MPSWNVHFGLKIDLRDPELLRLVERAHAFSTVIREIPIPPHLQLKISTMNIMRAVRGTTAIEGAQVSPEEVLQIIESPHLVTLPEARRRDEQEVRNAQEVMLFVAEILRQEPDHPVTQELICRLHELTTKGIDYQHNTPGAYRSHTVNVGDYRPPVHGDDVRQLMQTFIDWFRSPPVLHWDPIIRALVAHFYLVSIHPFADGNGRTSRALESFILYQGQVNARGFYSIANYYYEHRIDYVWHLDNARFNAGNDLTPFILFALRGLVSELQAVHAQILDEVKVISFRDYARELLSKSGKLGTRMGERALGLVTALGRTPLASSSLNQLASPTFRLYRAVSPRTIQRDIALLKNLDLIRVEDGMIVPNLEIMAQFTALQEMLRIQVENRTIADAAKRGSRQSRRKAVGGV